MQAVKLTWEKMVNFCLFRPSFRFLCLTLCHFKLDNKTKWSIVKKNSRNHTGKHLKSTNICWILLSVPWTLKRKRDLVQFLTEALSINPDRGIKRMTLGGFLPLGKSPSFDLPSISRNPPREPFASIDAGNAQWLPGWWASFFGECFALARTEAPLSQAAQTWQPCTNLPDKTHLAGFCSWNSSTPRSAEKITALHCK